MTWFVANMAWASLAMLLILALRRPFARLFGAGPAYALWLILPLRLLMPPMPSLAPAIPSPIAAGTLVVWAGDAAAPLPAAGGAWPWLPSLLAIWALGAAALLGWQWIAYRRFLAELGRSSRSLGAYRGLALVESAAVQGPVALGLLDRRIVVPADFAVRYSAEEQRLALDHERVHHRRGDIWWNLAGVVILALNWFNPVAWLAFRAFRADQELACDAAVAAAASAGTRHHYACALIKSASRPGLIAACPLNHADQLKRRLRMMKSHKRSRTRMLGGAAAIMTLAGLSFALGSPSFAQPDQQKQQSSQTREERHEHRIIIRTDDDDAGAAEHRDAAGQAERSERVIVMTHRGDGHGDHAGMPHAGMHDGHATEVIIPSCDHGQADEVNEGGDQNRTRIVLCSRGNATPAERAERLQRARDRLAGDSELSAEQKARITAALDRRIAELRGQ